METKNQPISWFSKLRSLWKNVFENLESDEIFSRYEDLFAFLSNEEMILPRYRSDDRPGKIVDEATEKEETTGRRDDSDEEKRADIEFLDEIVKQCLTDLSVQGIEKDEELMTIIFKSLGFFLHHPSLARMLCDERVDAIFSIVFKFIFSSTSKIAASLSFWLISIQQVNKTCMLLHLDKIVSAIVFGLETPPVISKALEFETMAACASVSRRFGKEFSGYIAQWLVPVLKRSIAKNQKIQDFVIAIIKSSLPFVHIPIPQSLSSEVLCKLIEPPELSFFKAIERTLNSSNRVESGFFLLGKMVLLLGDSIFSCINPFLGIAKNAFESESESIRFAVFDFWDCFIENFRNGSSHPSISKKNRLSLLLKPILRSIRSEKSALVRSRVIDCLIQVRDGVLDDLYEIRAEKTVQPLLELHASAPAHSRRLDLLCEDGVWDLMIKPVLAIISVPAYGWVDVLPFVSDIARVCNYEKLEKDIASFYTSILKKFTESDDETRIWISDHELQKRLCHFWDCIVENMMDGIYRIDDGNETEKERAAEGVAVLDRVSKEEWERSASKWWTMFQQNYLFPLISGVSCSEDRSKGWLNFLGSLFYRLWTKCNHRFQLDPRLQRVFMSRILSIPSTRLTPTPSVVRAPVWIFEVLLKSLHAYPHYILSGEWQDLLQSMSESIWRDLDVSIYLRSILPIFEAPSPNHDVNKHMMLLWTIFMRHGFVAAMRDDIVDLLLTPPVDFESIVEFGLGIIARICLREIPFNSIDQEDDDRIEQSLKLCESAMALFNKNISWKVMEPQRFVDSVVREVSSIMKEFPFPLANPISDASEMSVLNHIQMKVNEMLLHVLMTTVQMQKAFSKTFIAIVTKTMIWLPETSRDAFIIHLRSFHREEAFREFLQFILMNDQFWDMCEGILKASSPPRLTKNAIEDIIRAFFQCVSENSHSLQFDDDLLRRMEHVVRIGMQRPRLQDSTISFWNSTFGSTHDIQSYPDRLASILKVMKRHALLSLPHWDTAQEEFLESPRINVVPSQDLFGPPASTASSSSTPSTILTTVHKKSHESGSLHHHHRRINFFPDKMEMDRALQKMKKDSVQNVGDMKIGGKECDPTLPSDSDPMRGSGSIGTRSFLSLGRKSHIRMKEGESSKDTISKEEEETEEIHPASSLLQSPVRKRPRDAMMQMKKGDVSDPITAEKDDFVYIAPAKKSKISQTLTERQKERRREQRHEGIPLMYTSLDPSSQDRLGSFDESLDPGGSASLAYASSSSQGILRGSGSGPSLLDATGNRRVTFASPLPTRSKQSMMGSRGVPKGKGTRLLDAPITVLSPWTKKSTMELLQRMGVKTVGEVEGLQASDFDSASSAPASSSSSSSVPPICGKDIESSLRRVVSHWKDEVETKGTWESDVSLAHDDVDDVEGNDVRDASDIRSVILSSLLGDERKKEKEEEWIENASTKDLEHIANTCSTLLEKIAKEKGRRG